MFSSARIHTYGVEVWKNVTEWKRGHNGERGDDTKGRQSGELGVVFIDILQISALAADTKGIEDNFTFAIFKGGGIKLDLLGSLNVNSAFRLLFLLFSDVGEVLHNSLEGFLSGFGVGSTAILKVGDTRPSFSNLLWRKRTVGGEANATGALPADLGNPTAANFKDAAGFLVAAVSEVADERSDVFGLEGLDHLGRHNGSSHTGTSVGSNDVADNVLALAFKGKRLGETNNTEFGSAVVGLAKVAIQTDGRSSVNDTTVLLLGKVGPGSLDN